jgi:hypothetical protein
MAIEKLFIDDRTGFEMRCFSNKDGNLFISIADPGNRMYEMFIELTQDEAKLLIEHIMLEMGLE